MSKRFARLAIGAILVAGLADLVWNLRLVGFRLVDEDAAIFWYAAREFAGLHFREPFFYGQTYFHLGEALVAAPWVAAGVPPWVALPAVSALVGLASWLALAALAWRREAYGLAMLLVGGPLFLPVGYSILLERFFGLGLLLVSLGILAADTAGSDRRGTVAGFLVALGSLLVPNAALLAVVGLAWLVAARRGALPWRGLLVGALLAIALYGLGLVFHRLDPAWAVHPAPTLDVSWERFVAGMSDLPRHLGRLTSRPLGHPGVVLLALSGVAVAAAVGRRWQAAAPAAVLVGAALMALSLNKAHEGTPSIFFAFERMYLGLPLAVGLVGIGAVGTEPWRGGTSARTIVACGLAVAATTGWRWASLPGDVATELSDRRSVLDVGDVEGAVAACRDAQRAARAEGTGLLVYLAHRTLAYTCGALAYGEVATLYPTYERRTWIIREEAGKRRNVVVVPDVDAESVCGAVLERIPGASCGVGGGGAMVVRMPPMSVVDFARRLGVPVRRF